MRFDRYLPAGLFTVAFLGLLPFFWPKVDCDMISYITMSKHITHGDFFQSVNSYWSPLLSWMLVPFILTGINPILAFKLLNLIAGVLILIQLYDLSASYLKVRWQQLILPLFSIHHLLYHSLNSPTPDIIAFACWLLFFNQLRILVEQSTFNWKRSILTGTLGAISYLAKYYNFYASILFLGFAVVYVLLSDNRKYLVNILLTGLVFCILSSIWLLVLYNKFHEFTPTSASAYNMSLLRPGGTFHPMQVGDSILPIDYTQFTVSSWEYPPVYSITKWSPFASLEDLKLHLLIRIKTNILHLRNKHAAEFFCLILACLATLVIRKKYERKEWFLLVSVFLYAIGYMWVIVLNRYILFSICLATLWMMLTASKLEGRKYILAVCILLITGLRTNYTTFRQTLSKAKEDSGFDYLNFFTEANQQHTVLHQRILCSQTTWRPAVIYSYYTESLLFDVLKPELLQSNLPTINTLGIDYYLCERNEVPEWLKDKVVFKRKWSLGEWNLIKLR